MESPLKITVKKGMKSPLSAATWAVKPRSFIKKALNAKIYFGWINKKINSCNRNQCCNYSYFSTI